MNKTLIKEIMRQRRPLSENDIKIVVSIITSLNNSLINEFKKNENKIEDTIPVYISTLLNFFEVHMELLENASLENGLLGIHKFKNAQ